MLSETVVVLDLEATGFYWEQGDRVTEVAALRLRGNQITDQFTSLVNCGITVPGHISKFTGISQAMVDAAPEPTEVFRQLVRFIGTDTVIAHSAAFDEGFLAHECRRLGVNLSAPEFICSVAIARRIFPTLRAPALGSIASRLGLPFEPNRHRAMVDATITAKLVMHACDILCNRLFRTSVNVEHLRMLARQRTEAAPFVSTASPALEHHQMLQG